MQDNRPKYVTLVRVSTEDQARSGLGLEAQENAIEKYLENLPHSPNAVSYTHLTLPTNREV